MKVSREKAEENRRNVIENAGLLFREHGFDGVGVNTLMQAAGLTHGGFYKQFKSKGDLMVQATGAALNATTSSLEELLKTCGASPLEAITRFYLSNAHRDARAEGCALAALGAEVARHGPELQNVVQAGLEDQLRLLELAVPARPSQSKRERAIAALSTMVGALVLARAVADPEISGEILEAARTAVLDGEPPLGRAGAKVPREKNA